MDANWANKIEIGVSESNGTWTYETLAESIEGMDFAENEQNQQYFFLKDKGFAHNEVTGSAPELVVTGRRIVGDAAQDFIVGLQFKHGDERNTSVKITSGGKVITGMASIGAITSLGGQTLDVNAFGCTIRFNGEPTITTAA